MIDVVSFEFTSIGRIIEQNTVGDFSKNLLYFSNFRPAGGTTHAS